MTTTSRGYRSHGHPVWRGAIRHRYGRSHVADAWLTVLKAVALATVVALVSAGSIAGIAAWHLTHTVATGALDISNGGSEKIPSVAAMNGAFNVLLVGEDNTPDQKHFGEARDARDVWAGLGVNDAAAVPGMAPDDFIALAGRIAEPAHDAR